MCAVEYIIDEYGNLTTKSGISLESQFPVVNSTNNNEVQKINKVINDEEIEVEKMNKEFIPYETMKEKTESILPKEERQKLVEKYVNDYNNSKLNEALDGLFDLVTCQGSFEKAQKYYNVLEEAITELQTIKKTKPSEAMKCVDRLNQTINMAENFYDAPYEDKDLFAAVQRDVDTIKHSLLKAQEQEKELAKYKKEDKTE